MQKPAHLTNDMSQSVRLRSNGCDRRMPQFAVVATGIFLIFLLIPTSQGAAIPTRQSLEATASSGVVDSQRCHGDQSGNCSQHSLQCGDGHRLAILEAAYGFKPSDVHQACQSKSGNDSNCSQQCCSFNSSSDCKQEFSQENLDVVQTHCSHNQTCHIPSYRGDNIACSATSSAVTSTYSFLKARCVPDAATIDPCENATVSGHDVVLYHDSSTLPPTGYCYCRIDTTINNNTATTTTTTTTITTNSDSNVQVTVYDVQASYSGRNSGSVRSNSSDAWLMEVRGGGGQVVTGYSGDGGGVAGSAKEMEFPAASFSTASAASTSSPLLRATLAFYDLERPTTLRRVWIGFEATASSLTLRCGQDALNYEQSLATPPVTATSTVASSTERASTDRNSTHDASVNGTLTPSTHAGSTQGASTHSSQRASLHPGGSTQGASTQSSTQSSTTTRRTSNTQSNVNRQPVSDNSEGNNATGGTSAGGEGENGIDTTDIIVYAAVGLASLVGSAFLYVFVGKVCKKGCPHWCPPPFRDMECGKNDDDDNNNTDRERTGQRSRSNGETGRASHSRHSNGFAAGADSTDRPLTPRVPMGNGHTLPFSQRPRHFEMHKRPRGSLYSLRRPSFGDLENITESEEESRFPTHHNHSQLNLEELEQIYHMVDSRLASVSTDSNIKEEDDEVEDDEEGKVEQNADGEGKGEISVHDLDIFAELANGDEAAAPDARSSTNDSPADVAELNISTNDTAGSSATGEKPTSGKETDSQNRDSGSSGANRQAGGGSRKDEMHELQCIKGAQSEDDEPELKTVYNNIGGGWDTYDRPPVFFQVGGGSDSPEHDEEHNLATSA